MGDVARRERGDDRIFKRAMWVYFLWLRNCKSQRAKKKNKKTSVYKEVSKKLGGARRGTGRGKRFKDGS